MEAVFEELVDLVCDVLQQHPSESIRQRAQALRVADHSRRLTRDGKHPEIGETRDEYEEAIKRNYGRHPRTGETLDDFAKSSWGRKSTSPAAKKE